MKNRGQFKKGYIPWMKGKHHSEESNKKNRDAHIGKPSWNRGIKLDRDKFPDMGHFKPCSNETKEKIGEANFKDGSSIKNIKRICIICQIPFYTSICKIEKGKGKYCSSKCKYKGFTKFLSGEKAHTWRGGISRLPYNFEFNKELKEIIRERDNYKCQLCGAPQVEFIKKLPIHHVDYDKENSDEKNLITLCFSCNSKVNTNREYWTEYFSKLIEVYYA